MTRSEWSAVAKPYDGQVVTFIGCFEPEASAQVINGDPKFIVLLARKYHYGPSGGLALEDAEPPRAIPVHFAGDLPIRPSDEVPQPFAVTGHLRVGDERANERWASLEAIRAEPIHRIPVGPPLVIDEASVEDVGPIDASTWERIEGGQRLSVGKHAVIRLLRVVRKAEYGPDMVIPIKPGGYYKRAGGELRVVPDPADERR
jgi:hypothetical protein